MTFADNLKTLPPVDTVQRIELRTDSGKTVGIIENKPGQQGSLAVYNHLLSQFGRISVEAAQEGLRLYAEHTEDARQYPGKHPNIDRLLQVQSTQEGLEGAIVGRH